MAKVLKQESKMIIYQVFPRLFGNLKLSSVKNGSLVENGVGKFSAFSSEALQKIKELGITHMWYTGVIEHATKTDYTAYGIRKDHNAIVKGTAGSSYAIKDYYDIDSDLAEKVPERMKEFEDLVERTHEAGLKVLIDFVPNHVARQYHSDNLQPFVEDLGQHDDTSKAFDVNNNFYYIPGQPLTLHFGSHEHGEFFEYSEFPAKVTGNDRFDADPSKDDWYETIKLNYGIDYVGGRVAHFETVPNTWHKMLDILKFWSQKGIDGFRCDMAEMVPVEFWNWAIPQVKKVRDVCFIAEVYNPGEYRNYLYTGHFDYLYDKVGLYDTLKAVMRKEASASILSKCWQSLEGIQHQMLNFLENHDEQRIASDFFAGDARLGIPAMIVSAAMNTNPFMIYSGQELGERGMDEEGFSGRDGRTTIFDYWSVDSVRDWINNWKFDGGGLNDDQKALRDMYAKILNVVKTDSTISNGLFHDLMYVNENNPYFNSDRQYVFLRKYKNEILLVVVNFDKAEQTVRVQIPEEVFKLLDILENKAAKVVDLLSGEETVGTLTSAWPYQVVLPSYSGKMLKFTY